MTAPSLAQLRDIHLPPPPGAFSLSPIEMALLGFTVAAALVAARALWRQRRRTRPLRTALAQLAHLERAHAATPDDVAFARGLSQLLRRYAQWRYPQASVAGLAGSAWLGFLDAHFRSGSFRAAPGDVLASLPYAPPTSAKPRPPLDAAALAGLVRSWLKENAP